MDADVYCMSPLVLWIVIYYKEGTISAGVIYIPNWL